MKPDKFTGLLALVLVFGISSAIESVEPLYRENEAFFRSWQKMDDARFHYYVMRNALNDPIFDSFSQEWILRTGERIEDKSVDRILSEECAYHQHGKEYVFAIPFDSGGQPLPFWGPTVCENADQFIWYHLTADGRVESWQRGILYYEEQMTYRSFLAEKISPGRYRLMDLQIPAELAIVEPRRCVGKPGLCKLEGEILVTFGQGGVRSIEHQSREKNSYRIDHRGNGQSVLVRGGLDTILFSLEYPLDSYALGRSKEFFNVYFWAILREREKRSKGQR